MSVSEDDELLDLFLEESRESLDGIESDLLSIEAAGATIDDALVNKVFRAVHSVKGGAGFFNLDKVRKLAHSMENVLGLIRNHELVPNKEVVGCLLEGADELVSMINNVSQMEQTDIGPIALKLELLVRKDGEPSAGAAEPVRLPIKQGERVAFDTTRVELESARRAEHAGDHVYLVVYDLIADIQRKDRNPLQVINELVELVSLVDARIDFDAVGTLDSYDASAAVPFVALVSTHMEGALLAELLELDEHAIKKVHFDAAMTSGSLEAITKVHIESLPTATTGPQLAAEPMMTEQPQLSAALPISTPPPSATANSRPNATQSTGTQRPATVAAETASAGGLQAASTDRPNAVAKMAENHGSIRVRLDVLERLMTLAGELVLTRNQLTQSVGSNVDKTEEATQRIDLITTELQDAIMATRMQSIGIVFHKFRRVVRDLAAQLGKEVELQLEGEDVELDRTIIEAIGDPLTHLVRNALDHGLEAPSERRAAQKNQNGNLRLSAFHKAGNVIIEIEDDGRGIDPQKVKAKAASKGIMTLDQLDAMSDQALQRLIFRPGFSTAEKVTDMSGRGVGMDVVVSNLTKLGGVVDIDSQVNRGTLISIKLPLTLAIIPALLVKEEGDTFAIPQASLIELLRIPARDVKHKIKQVGNSLVMLLRGELLPLVRLREVLEMPSRTYLAAGGREPDRRALTDRRASDLPFGARPSMSPEAAERREGAEPDRRGRASAVNVAIVAAGEFHFGLTVEALMDSSEIVVKPLGRHLRDCPAYAGATILGDGRSALILDVIGISKRVRASAENDVRRARQAAENKTAGDRLTLVLVEGSAGEVLAVPMELVERIERIKRDDIQQIGGKRTLYYRGKSLLLFTIGDVVDVPPIRDTARPYVLVFRYRQREVGLLVSNLIDIDESVSEVDDETHRQPGISGSIVIDGRIILLADLYGIAAKMLPPARSLQASSNEQAVTARVPNAPQNGAAAAPSKSATLLVVDDSKFFLNKLVEIVTSVGHRALTAINGNQALDVLNQNAEQIDLVLTDIEMPELDGFGFATKVRQDDRFADLPLVAVTSVMGTAAEARGRAAGIDEYIVKLDRELIIDRIEQLLRDGRPR